MILDSQLLLLPQGGDISNVPVIAGRRQVRMEFSTLQAAVPRCDALCFTTLIAMKRCALLTPALRGAMLPASPLPGCPDCCSTFAAKVPEV